MYYHIQLVNFVCHDIHRSLILIIVIKTVPFLYFLIRPNEYIFTTPLYCFLSPHFIKICPNVERSGRDPQIWNLLIVSRQHLGDILLHNSQQIVELEHIFFLYSELICILRAHVLIGREK